MGPMDGEPVRLGPRAENLADIWSPRGEPSDALVVVVHGGFWRPTYDRTHTAPMCAALARAGHTVAAIEYRRLGRSDPDGWVATLDDVRLALTRLPSALASAGVAVPTRMLLVGHSAGGHLVLWAASGDADVPLPRLSGVVSLAGVADLRRADELDLGAGAVAAFLGGHADEVPERYAAADPCVVRAPAVPVLLVHGLEDDVVPVELSRRYAAHVTRAGGSAEMVELPGVEHFGPIEPDSQAWGAVTGALDRLLRR